MNELRELRRAADLGQREFADVLSVPLETFRTWDSGRRPIPVPVLHQATAAVAHHQRQNELLPLDQLAKELGVRWRLAGRGKRGGIRAIYYLRSRQGELWMLTLYAKNKAERIPGHILKKIKEEIDGGA